MLDYILFSRLAVEISRETAGQWIRKIIQPGRFDLALHFGKEKALIISVASGFGSLYCSAQEPLGSIRSPFLLLAKKYLKDQKIIACRQVSGQKILIFQTHQNSLVVELPGIKNAMYILNEEKKILAAMPPRESGEAYAEPPLPSPHLFLASKDEIAQAWPVLYSGQEKRWWGLGKAHWAILRQYPQDEALKLFLESRKNFDTASVFVVQSEKSETLSLIPPPSNLKFQVLQESIGVYDHQKLMQAAFEKRKKHYVTLIRQAIEKMKKKRGLQTQGLQEAEKYEDFKRFGDLILAYRPMIESSTQDQLIVPETGEVIVLDSTLDAVRNAQQYYKRYKKGKSGLAGLLSLLKALEQELNTLQELETWTSLAESDADLDLVQVSLEKLHLIVETERERVQTEKRRLLKVEVSPGWHALAGRNAIENAAILRQAKRDDVWFHAHGIPGGHVILITLDRVVPSTVLERAAQLAAYYSQGRGWDKVPVDYTHRKDVRFIPGSQSHVTFRSHKTLVVKPVNLGYEKVR